MLTVIFLVALNDNKIKRFIKRSKTYMFKMIVKRGSKFRILKASKNNNVVKLDCIYLK